MTEDAEDEEGAREKAGLKPTQVAASALAAVTAAFLGSYLGVAGTVAGAGVASVVSTVGSEVYLRSLRKTHEAARRTKDVIAQAPRQGTQRAQPLRTRLANPLRRSDAPAPRPASDPTVQAQAGNDKRDDKTVFLNPGDSPMAKPDNDKTVFLNQGDRPTAKPDNDDDKTAYLNPQQSPTKRVDPSEGPTVHLPQPALPGEAEPTAVVPAPDSATTGPKRPWWKSGWALAAGVSVFAFLVSMLVITGFETATGRTLSGDPGTTVGRLTGGGAPAQSPKTTPSSPSTSTSETPSTTLTETPSSTAPSSAQHEAPSSSSIENGPTSGPASNTAPLAPSSETQPTPMSSPSVSPSRALGDLRIGR